jgi:hypothetical protein
MSTVVDANISAACPSPPLGYPLGAPEADSGRNNGARAWCNAEKNADEITALTFAPAEMKKRRPSGKKVYKPHLATKVRWALQDSEERMIEAQRLMFKVLDWMEEERGAHKGDCGYLARLGQLSHYLARVTLAVTESERVIATALVESKTAKSE